MPSFRIEGGHQLFGEVVPSGNKNAALPLMTASLMTNGEVTLHNVPQIGDVATMRHLLESMGVEAELTNGSTLKLRSQGAQRAQLDPELCRSIRASILLAGPMLSRFGGIDLPPPGGDVIGMVTGPEGRPYAGASVRLANPRPSLFAPARSGY